MRLVKGVHGFWVRVLFIAASLFQGAFIVGAASTSSPSNCVPVASSMSAWWKGESNAVDEISVGRPDNMLSVAFARGVVGTAFDFNGQNAYIVVTNNPAMRFTNRMTIELWLYPRTSDGQFHEILSSWNFAAYSYTMALNPAQRLAFAVSPNGADSFGTIESTAVIQPNTWVHVAVTYDGAFLKLYLNGKLDRSVQYSAGIFPATQLLTIGRTLSAASLFNGLIDELSFYQTPLDENAINQIASAGSAGKCLGECPGSLLKIQNWWKGDTSTVDVQNPGLYSQPYDLQYAIGNVGQAFDFNGTSSFISVTNVPAIVLQNNMSIEMWIYPRRVGTEFYEILSSWEGPSFYSYTMALNPARQFAFAVSPNGISSFGTIESAATIVPNQWTHVAVTYNGAELRVYINGSLDKAVAYTGGIFPAKRELTIGTTRAAHSFFDGLVDELTFYRETLAQEVIRSIYLAGAAGKCALQQPPFFVFQPSSSTNYVGDTLRLEASAAGAAPLYLQWFSSVGAIAGATNTSLVLSNLAVGAPTNYFMVASNAFGRATSSVATVYLLASRPCIPAPNGILAWWPGGASATEVVSALPSTNLRVGSQPGRVGEAFAFDGNSAIIISNVPVLLQQSISIEAWIKRASPPVGTSGTNASPGAAIFTTGPGGYSLYLADSGHLRFGKLNSQMANLSPSTNLMITDTNWHHLVVIQSGSSASLFLDGQFSNWTYSPGFFTYNIEFPASIGARFATNAAVLQDGFNGLIDELTIYAGTLTFEAARNLYLAGAAGKCRGTFAPVIVSGPYEQSVMAGGTARFQVVAAGQDLIYQWQFNGVNLIGATNSILVINKVHGTNTGYYRVLVQNASGSLISRQAWLAVITPITTVQLRDVVSGPAGSVVEVPVILSATGAENALGFSVRFDTNRLAFMEARLGSAATGALLLVNNSRAAVGSVGFAVALNAGSTFPSGTNDLLILKFNSQISTFDISTALTFADDPTMRQVSDQLAAPLQATYRSGSVYIPRSAYEADVTPRPNGDRNVSITDWVQVGRFVARLDTATTGSEFQRADCAPKSSRGDGRLAATDWVQAGRYASGLDPIEFVAGPSVPSILPATRRLASEPGTSNRKVSISSRPAAAENCYDVAVILDAEGNESGVSFSLAFDASALELVSAKQSVGLADAAANINLSAAGNGQIGFAMASMRKFSVGPNEILLLNFRAKELQASNSTLAFVDQPVPRDVASFEAESLPTAFIGGAIVVSLRPTLKVARVGDSQVLTWLSAGAAFDLEESDSLGLDAVWTQTQFLPNLVGNEHRVAVPSPAGAKYFRLRQK